MRNASVFCKDWGDVDDVAAETGPCFFAWQAYLRASFRKSERPNINIDPNRALILWTPTKRTPFNRNSYCACQIRLLRQAFLDRSAAEASREAEKP